MRVPLVDLAAQQREIDDEVMDAIRSIFDATAFIGGQQVAEFEESYATLAGADFCVGVANGTDALEIALRAAGVTADGEVIMPANTFIATAEAVSRIGAKPVFVDVDPDYLLISPEAVSEAVNERTQAIMPVHLFGQVAPVEKLIPIAEGVGAVVVEDAAQAQGASRNGVSAGSLGVAAGTSFYPGKNLGAAGDAGAITTSDPAIAHRARLLGAHGSPRKYVHEVVGMNSRLDTIQAAVLLAKLKRLLAWNECRRSAASKYAELLSDVPAVRVPHSMAGNVDVWHLYVVQVEERDRILAELNAGGVGAGIHYPTPIHMTEAYADLGYQVGDFPVAEQAADRILSLPIFPHITTQQQEFIVSQLKSSLSPSGN